MKTLITLLITLPSLASAHCPISIEAFGESYCTKLEWIKAEKKVQGTLITVENESPQLIAMGEIPQKWIFSKALFKIWKDGDSNHIPQQIKDFKVFPYMNMESGHHHSASYNFIWDPQTESYQISALALQEMEGCWSLRWTIDSKDDLSTSEFMMNITDYKNLTVDANKEMTSYCENSDNGGHDDNGGHSGHHNHE